MWVSWCMLFPVTLEWSTWVCKVIHSLSRLQSCNLVCDIKLVCWRFHGLGHEAPYIGNSCGVLFITFFVVCCNKYHSRDLHYNLQIYIRTILPFLLSEFVCSLYIPNICLASAFLWESANVVSRRLHYKYIKSSLPFILSEFVCTLHNPNIYLASASLWSSANVVSRGLHFKYIRSFLPYILS